jgi:hypothetical protein
LLRQVATLRRSVEGAELLNRSPHTSGRGGLRFRNGHGAKLRATIRQRGRFAPLDSAIGSSDKFVGHRSIPFGREIDSSGTRRRSSDSKTGACLSHVLLVALRSGQLLFAATLSRFGFHRGPPLGFAFLNHSPSFDEPFFRVADVVMSALSGQTKGQVFAHGSCRESQILGELWNRLGNQRGRLFGHCAPLSC